MSLLSTLGDQLSSSRRHWFLRQDSDPGLEGWNYVHVVRGIDRGDHEDIELLILEHLVKVILIHQ